MKLLLDTHALYWWSDDQSLLSETARKLIKESTNEILVSVASLHELQIKHQLGKLKLIFTLQELVDRCRTDRMTLLPIEAAHIYALQSLPMHHRDPFDRLLIAQAITLNCPLVSKDTHFSQYPAQVLW